MVSINESRIFCKFFFSFFCHEYQMIDVMSNSLED